MRRRICPELILVPIMFGAGVRVGAALGGTSRVLTPGETAWFFGMALGFALAVFNSFDDVTRRIDALEAGPAGKAPLELEAEEQP